MWGFGCIMSQLAAKVEKDDKAALYSPFKGGSCFPLSPLHGEKADDEEAQIDSKDQLFKILETKEIKSDDFYFLKDKSARSYAKLINKNKKLRTISKSSFLSDLISNMTEFNPDYRFSAE